MFDSSLCLADMAVQVRSCRSADGLTLQQLAARSGVAASTIHKVEAQQMIPTVGVLLKIAKGLGRRPQDLIRDEPMLDSTDGFSESFRDESPAHSKSAGGAETKAARPETSSSPSSALAEGSLPGSEGSSPGNGANGAATNGSRPVSVWHLSLSETRRLPTIDLHPLQRAILLVQAGVLELQAGDDRIQMGAGHCIEVEGGRIESRAVQPESATLMLIVSPPGNLDLHLGKPTSSSPNLR